MDTSCTIYIEHEYDKILDYLEAAEMRNASDSEIKTFEKDYAEGLLRVSLKKRFEPGDSYSKLILGTCNYFEQIETLHLRQKKELSDRILETKTAIGIVAEPEFKESDVRQDFVFELTQKFDGIIFYGSGMMDKEGRVILDSDGHSEI